MTSFRWPFPAAMLALLAGCFSCGTAFPLQQSRPRIVQLQVGFEGVYRAGAFCPLKITLADLPKAPTLKLRLTTPDGDGVGCRVEIPLPNLQTQSVEIGRLKSPWPAFSHWQSSGNSGPLLEVETLVRFGRVQSWLDVQVTDGSQILLEKRFTASAGQIPAAIPGDKQLYLVGGADDLGLELAVRNMRFPRRNRPVVVRLSSANQLPLHWLAYEGVHSLVLGTGKITWFDSHNLPGRIAALKRWVQSGGMLVLCLGRNTEQMLKRQLFPGLEELVGGRFQQMVPLTRQRRAILQNYCASSTPIALHAVSLEIPFFQLSEAVAEIADGNLPLVARRVLGFGRVTTVMADLDLPPIADWSDRATLLATIMQLEAYQPETDTSGTTVMHHGFEDVAGQLRSALDLFQEVKALPFALILTLIVVYLAIIGPADYFLLRRLGGRMWLTWVTFPTVVLLFILLAVFVGRQTKSTAVLIRQAEILDVNVKDGLVRSTTWFNVYSPKTTHYDVSYLPTLPDCMQQATPAVALGATSWFGLPGTAVRGMSSANTATLAQEVTYQQLKLEHLANVPIQVWSTKSFTARWLAQADSCLDVRLQIQDGQPQGYILHHLPCTLRSAMLVHGDYVYQLDDLPPGQPALINLDTPRRELKAWLTGQRLVRDQDKDFFRPELTPYDRASRDLQYILRTMSFFQAAGGKAYTGLWNNYQHFTDFTWLLRTDYAVLFGFADSNANSTSLGTTISCSNDVAPSAKVDRTLLVRFILPLSSGQ